jgi:anti-sigma factor RsiW
VLCGWARRQMVCADALSDEERWALEEHIRQCPECARHWQGWERFWALLPQLPRVAPPPDAKQKLLTTLRQLPTVSVPDWDCATTRRNLWRWLDGDLSPSEQVSLIAHLAECDACQSELWVSERLLSLLRTLPKVPAPSEGKEALKKRLAHLQRRPTVFRRSSPHWSFPHWSLPHWSLVIRRTIVPFAAAAAIVAALIGYGLRNFPQGSEPLTVARQPTPPTSPPRSPSLTPSPKSLPSVKPIQGMPKEVAERPRPTTATKLAQRPQPSRPMRPVVQRPTMLMERLPERPTLPPRPSSLVPSSLPEPMLKVRPPLAERPATEQPAPEPLIAPTAPTTERPEPKLAMPSEAPQTVEAKAEAKTAPLIPTPSIASLPSAPSEEGGKFVALPPITIETEKPFVRPPLRLSQLPPSQRLYRKAGVAFLKVEPEKRPLIPPAPMPSSEPSIPMASERFRSRTAIIPITRLGISW